MIVRFVDEHCAARRERLDVRKSGRFAELEPAGHVADPVLLQELDRSLPVSEL